MHTVSIMNDGKFPKKASFIIVRGYFANLFDEVNLLKDVQAAHVEMVIKRLVYRTEIEIEGWKRIPAVRRLFEAASLQVINLRRLRQGDSVSESIFVRERY